MSRSVRNTPGRNSSTAAFDPSATGSGHPHHSARTPSFSNNARASVPDIEYGRRPSDRSLALARTTSRTGSIAPSYIGTSTPTLSSYGRRRRTEKEGTSAGNLGAAGATGGKDDWADVEPDEVFRRLPVHEVKRVEAKMRSEALNKQSELRSMVGTRYRDLLTSATQITSLHSSSIRLSDSLREIARSCVNPDINITLDGAGDEDGGGSDLNSNKNEEDVVSLLPVAAHMKLLLDAPEALYSFLAHQAFLNAAFLWLITRVVKEGLSNMPPEQNAAYLPLLQKQWETLLPFRAQISQRATASLRTKERLDPKVLSETLLSIILLDNLSLPDALGVLLSQRTKALQDTLRHPFEFRSGTNRPRTSLSLSPENEKEKEKGRKRSNSRIQAANAIREAAHGRDHISSVLTDAVHALLETIVAAKAVFEKRKSGPMLDGESVLEEMMRLVQKGEVKQPSGSGASSTSHQPPPVRRTSQQRRASRLASISLPIPILSPSGSRPPVSAPQILQGLPSSQILLRHLPNSITGFTPFISHSSTPTLSNTLGEWQRSTIDILKQAVPNWLAGLKNVSDIWAVRTSLSQVLVDGAFEAAINVALEDQWGRRVQEVWDEKLEELINLAEREITEAAEMVQSGGDKTDTNTDTFLFSALTFPSAPASTFSVANHGTSFSTFRSTLKKRIDFRTSSLDGVLSALERFASDLKGDMEGLPSSLYVVYGDKLLATLRALVAVLEKVLTGHESDKEIVARHDGLPVEAELLVGRVALYLGKSSSFLSDIAGQANLDKSTIEADLLEVHVKSTKRWRTRAIEDALVLLAPLFDPHRGAGEIRAAWQGGAGTVESPSSPSHPIFVSLQSLVASIQQLGVPPELNAKSSIVIGLVETYVGAAKGLEGWNTAKKSAEAAAQAAVDVGFLVRLTGKQVGDDEAVKAYLSIASKSYPILTENIHTTIDQSLRRSQLLLYPLLSGLESTQSTPSLGSSGGVGRSYNLDTRNAALLRFGAPSASSAAGGSTTEYRSPVVIAKPGKRMGLLSIAA